MTASLWGIARPTVHMPAAAIAESYRFERAPCGRVWAYRDAAAATARAVELQASGGRDAAKVLPVWPEVVALYGVEAVAC